MNWNEKLYQGRKLKELDQRELGKQAKTNHVQISRIEKGAQMPKADMLYRICKVLNLSMDYVFENYDKIDKKKPSKYY